MTSLRNTLARIAESHPYIWRIAWEALHRFSFLLPHDPSYHAFRHFIKAAPGGLFLDIGANDGISVLSFRVFDRDYRILSIEPNALLQPALEKIKRRDPRFDYRMVGAGSTPARTLFYVPSYHGILLHTFTSGSSEQIHQAMAAAFGQRVANGARIVAFENDIIRLDDLDLDPSIVKIDAEGFEHEILLGLERTITRSRPFIAVEIAWERGDRSVQELLEGLDYVILDYDVKGACFGSPRGKTATMQSGHRNSFAIPKEKAGQIPTL